MRPHDTNQPIRWGCIAGEIAFSLLMLAGLYGIGMLYVDAWRVTFYPETGMVAYDYTLGERVGVTALLTVGVFCLMAALRPTIRFLWQDLRRIWQ